MATMTETSTVKLASAPPAVHELEAIKNVRDLPGDWLVDEWKTFDESEAQSLAASLHPKIVKLLQGDEAEFQALIAEKGFWRDLVALSWTFRTFHGKENIVKRIPELIARAGIKDISPAATQVQVVNLPNHASLLRIAVPFSTSNPEAKCQAVFKFVRQLDGEIKLFTATTQLLEVAVAPWQDCVNTRPVSKTLPEKTDVLVIGGGHGGLSVGAYLSALGMDFAIVDREKEIGDAWAKRYDSATLHTTRVFSGLPYRPFPEDYEEYVKAKDLAKFYKHYAEDLKLPVYQDTTAEKATFDDAKKEWTVETSQGTIKAKVLLFSVGVGGRFPVQPSYEGKDAFKGEQMHSVQYTNPSAWKGKKVVVIGSSTTGLDVGLDCSELGIDVTIVQRGATRIYAPGHIAGLQKLFWNENSTAEMGDQITSEDPIALQEKLSALLMKHQTDAYDRAYYDGLKKAGFKAIHEGAVHNQIYIYGGKHYPDIGAGWAIVNGDIKIKSDSEVKNLDETGINFADGSHLDADVIVYCTGFKKDTRDILAGIIGEDIKLEPIWGLDKEGEVRGVSRPTGHDYIWQNGGELQSMRWMGRFLAMQLAALLSGVRPEPVRH